MSLRIKTNGFIHGLGIGEAHGRHNGPGNINPTVRPMRVFPVSAKKTTHRSRIGGEKRKQPQLNSVTVQRSLELFRTSEETRAEANELKQTEKLDWFGTRAKD